MNHPARIAALAPLLLALGLPACGSSYAERREALDAEWAVTNARSDEIHAEYNRRMRQAKTPEEREAIIAWRNAELEKNFADHRARKEDALRQMDE
jgi:hypothetical protein